MIPQINIFAMVDVVGALCAGTLTDYVFLADNRRGIHTSGLGSGKLSSDVVHAQVLNWHVVPIDVQTEIRINRIIFYRNGVPVTAANTPCARLQRYGAPSGEYWAGVVNYPHLIESGIYDYLIEFDTGRKRVIMEQFASINIRSLA